MWSHEIKNKQYVEGNIQVRVQYSNDADSAVNFLRTFFVTTLEGLKETIQSEILRLNGFDTVLASIPIGAVDVTVKPPTQGDIDRKNYFALIEKRNFIENQIKAGAIKPDDPLITDLEAQIKAAFKPEYIGL